MSNYYGFKTDGSGSVEAAGLELTTPVALWGVALLIFVSTVSSDFGDQLWAAALTFPFLVAFGLIVVMWFLAFIADDLGRTGLWIMCAACIVGIIAVVPFVLAISYTRSIPLSISTYDPPVAYKIGAGFAAYLGISLWLTITRLRRRDTESDPSKS